MTDQFEAQLGEVRRRAQEADPEYPVLRLESKLRQIHAERPDLDMHGALELAFDVFDGELADARIGMEQARAHVEQEAADEARFAAMQRIAARARDLDDRAADLCRRTTTPPASLP